MQTKEYLNQAYRLNELIRSNKLELDELRVLSESVSGIDTSKEPSGSSGSSDAGFAKIITKIIDLEKVIKDDIERMLSLKLDIRLTIDAVKNNDEKLLLKLRYLNFMQWEKICHEMNISMRTVHRIHSQALRNVKIKNDL